MKNCQSNQPLIVSVKNTSNSQQTARVFFPNATKADNYGNPKGIEVETLTIKTAEGIETPDYESLLSFINHKQIVVGMVYIQTLNIAGQSCMPYVVHSENVKNGSYSGFKEHPYLDPYQNQNGVSVTKRAFVLDNINGYGGFVMSVLPNASFYLFIFPSTISDKEMSKEELDAMLQPINTSSSKMEPLRFESQPEIAKKTSTSSVGKKASNSRTVRRKK